MLSSQISVRFLVVIAAATLTFLHQRLALAAWPFRTSVGKVLMEAPPSLIVAMSVGALFVASARTAATQTGPRRYITLVMPLVVAGLFFAGVIRLSDGALSLRGDSYSSGSLGYVVGTLGLFIAVAIMAAWGSDRRQQSSRPWQLAEWLLSVMLALNIFLIALPEVRFTAIAETLAVTARAPLSLHFGLQYADVLALSMNPIFDTMRWCLSSLVPTHFLTEMSCVYLMAISIGLFSLAVSRVVGYAGAFALVSGLAWSKSILLVVCTGTNIVTLFLAVAFALWVLSRACVEMWTPSRSAARILTGFLIGLAFTLSLYTYAPSRVPSFVFAGAALLVLLLGVLRDRRGRLSYVVAISAALITPGAVVFGQYGGDVAVFQRDFRGSILPDISRVRAGRPDFVDPELEASTPDMPITYGAVIADVPQVSGVPTREWVYWRRSVGELAWVFTANLGRIVRKYQPFPAGEVWWLFGLIGLAVSTRMMTSRRHALVYGAGVVAVSLTMIAPFLLVPSPAEWRRGAAVMLPFGALGGLGIFYTLRLCAPRASSGLLVSIAAVFAFLVFGKSSLRAITTTPFAEVAIAMPCRISFVKPLIEYAKTDQHMTGAIHMLGSSADRCLNAASQQLNRSLGSERVKLVQPPALTLAALKGMINPGDSLVVECGDAASSAIKGLCAELRGESSARSVYAAPLDGDNLWVYTR